MHCRLLIPNCDSLELTVDESADDVARLVLQVEFNWGLLSLLEEEQRAISNLPLLKEHLVLTYQEGHSLVYWTAIQ